MCGSTLTFPLFVCNSNASYEANKEQAKSSDLPVADRASAAFRAAGDKVDEKSAEAKAEGHKKTAQN
jgi:hypothetical protein